MFFVRTFTLFNVYIITFAPFVDVATGISMDWVKDVFKIPITYTYELRDKGANGFVLPASQIISTAEETFDSLVTMLQEFDLILPYENKN